MAKRPAQGRGSGGRVTPSTRSSSGPSGRGTGKGRVLQADERKARGGSARTVKEAAPEGRGVKLAKPTASAGERAEPAEGGSRPFSLARLFNPQAGLPPIERQRPWWGFGDVFAWFVIAQVLAIIVPLVLAQSWGYSLDRPSGRGSAMGEAVGRVLTGSPPGVTKTLADMPLWLSQGVLLLPLWAAFIGGSIYATVRKGFGPVRDLKIAIRPLDVPLGLAIGVVAQLVLNPLLYRLLFVFTGDQDVSAGARGITEKATSPLLIVLLFVTVGFVAPVAEELFFRGLALQSLVRRFGRVAGLLLSAVFFAVVHSNPLYFVALMPFAIILGWLVLRFDRLGPAIAAHVGYNLVTATVLVFDLQVPL